MLTARSETADRVRGLEAGVDDYLGKPYEPEGTAAAHRLDLAARAHAAAGARGRRVLRFGPFVFYLERGELRQRRRDRSG